MSMDSQNIVAGLTEILGSQRVIATLADMAAYLEEPRKRFHQTATAVAMPEDVAQVQTLVRWANDNRISLIPQGGNTGLVGGQVPISGDEIIVSLKLLKTVREVDAEAGHMTVESGLTLQEAQQVADEAGALLPLSIASQGSAQIGGVLSSNAGGVQVLAYGNARELCLGVEAVLPDGRLYQGLNALRKNNTGYDLRNLLVGAEGTLGIITAATLKLFPKPGAFETALVSVDSPEDALKLFIRTRERAGSHLTAFELVPRGGIDLQLKHKMITQDPSAGHAPWYALVELSLPVGTPEGQLGALLEAAYEAGIIGDATTIAASEAQRKSMWKMREQMSEVQSLEGASIKHDVAVPVAAVPALLAEGCAAVSKINPDIRPCPFGHIGDGNIHFNFTQPVGADAAEFMASAGPIHDAIYEVVLKLGGSVSAEHGIGQLKTELLKRVKDPVALDMMRTIKKSLDPNGIMNPGKILG